MIDIDRYLQDNPVINELFNNACNALVIQFKSHENAPENEELLKTICKYALKLTDIYDDLETKPDDWFDPSVIKPFMESDMYDPDIWLGTICNNEKNLSFLKEVVNFILEGAKEYYG